MIKWNKQTTAILLIIGSLTLLLAFLTNWVHRTYLDEKETLATEISYAIKDITRSIEDSLVHQVLMGEVVINIDTAETFIRTIRKEKSMWVDSVNTVFIQGQSDFPLSRRDSVIHLYVQTYTGMKHEDNSPSMLPILLNDPHGGSGSMVNFEESALRAVNLITHQLDDYLALTQLPGSYEIVKLGNEDKLGGLVVDFYQMPMQSSAYAASFSNYFRFVLSRMKYDILFALILFSAISISFYMIYSNWREQQKMIEIKNDFISNVTHELKTPISTVSVALEALSSFDVIKDKEKTKEYLLISKKELDRLKILVDKVLKMSIFEKGVAKLKLEELPLNILLTDVLSTMKVQFENKKAVVTTEFKGSNFDVLIDKIHMTNVIYNLLDNAIKYCTAIPKIHITLEESNGVVDLHIIDNGVGISEEEQSKVFQRFYRVPTGDTHNIKGHGLGLSYVASVIKQHKGIIKLKSRQNAGSNFHIRLNKLHVTS
jgi:signal transduction histidine kinase